MFNTQNYKVMDIDENKRNRAYYLRLYALFLIWGISYLFN